MDRTVRIGPFRAIFELLVVAVVPVLLTGIHVLLPVGLRERVVLDPGAPTLVTLFGSAFVHLDTAHLLGNLTGYTIAVGYAYVLALVAGERRWFWLSFVAILLSIPVLVNASWVVVVSIAIGGLSLPVRGFSAVVAGLGGLLFVALWVTVLTRRSRGTAMDVAWIGLLSLLAVLEFHYIDVYRVPVLGLTAVGIALSGGRLLRRGLAAGMLAPESRRRVLRDALIVVLGGVPLGVLVSGLFPVQLAEDGVITNVFAHFIGFAYGVVIARWGFRYWRRLPVVD